MATQNYQSLHDDWESEVDKAKERIANCDRSNIPHLLYLQKDLKGLLADEPTPYEDGEEEVIEEDPLPTHTRNDFPDDIARIETYPPMRQLSMMEALLSHKDAVRFWGLAYKDYPGTDITGSQFRDHTSREYQIDSIACRRIINLYIDAGVAKKIKETVGEKQTRITFRFTQPPPVEEIVAPISEGPIIEGLDEFKDQFVESEKGNEKARYGDFWIVLKSYNKGTKWENCINQKGVKGKWSKMFPTREAAIEDAFQKLTKLPITTPEPQA